MRKPLNWLNFSVTITFVFYLIDIYDWYLEYEIFITLPFVLGTYAIVGLLIVNIIEYIKLKQWPKSLPLCVFISLNLGFGFVYGSQNGLFEGEEYLDSYFLDDMSRIDLTLYRNGKYIIYSNWLFGENRFEGQYKRHGDTIIFEKHPVMDSDIMAKKIIIDRIAHKIYFSQREGGKYDTSFYYFPDTRLSFK